jgi:iron complex outermembrane receptor protein
VVNAGESRSRGIELEGRGELGAGFSAEGALGFLDTELESFVDSFGTDTSGNDLPQAPDTTLAFGLQYERDLARGHWYVRGDYQSVSDFSYDAGNRDGDSFDIVNLSLGARYGNFGATLWVQNLFDEEYVPIAFQPDPTNPAVFVGENGAPRVLGFTLSAHF